MDYKDFTPRQKAFDGFVKYRREVYDSIDNGDFYDVFTELCTKALSGDSIAQDCVAYFFKKGVPDFLMPNYDYYMAWQVLAGANGNEFALEKMEFFLQVAINTIIYDDNILQTALRRKNVTKDNALMVISNLICEGIADELNLDPKNFIKISAKPVQYSNEINRKYVLAMEKSISNVINFLIS